MPNAKKELHPESETELAAKTNILAPIEVETFDGKVRMEWDPEATVTPMGQLPFFIQYLKLGHRFEPWVEDCPLNYQSNNAPEKVDVLGSFLLSILSGHSRYAHIATLMSEQVNADLLGMNKIVSDDSARRALKRIDEKEGLLWLQNHLHSCYAPLLTKPWILDTDVTVKPLYGHQEGAKVGYNPHKPGRPSHTYHTYLMANLRLVLDVEVQAGDQAQSSHSLPGLLDLLDRLPADSRPEFIRGDCDWGSDKVMTQLEDKDYRYLFKLKKSKNVKMLISKHHSIGQWERFNDGWEVKEDELQLMGWDRARRVVIVRRRIQSDAILALDAGKNQQQMNLAFIDGPEDMKAYAYSVLVTNLKVDKITLVQHYRDRADCENYFDEIKNQWGWGGFTTKEMKSCRFISKMIGLIYNWWTLFVRLANPGNHIEAKTSRPLLLSSVGRLVRSGRQKKILMTSQHGNSKKVQISFERIGRFFKELKVVAPQLSSKECWMRILEKATEAFSMATRTKPPNLLPALI